MLLGNIENHQTIPSYSCLHGLQELDCINTINITFYRIHTFLDLGHHNFSPYPEHFCNFQQNLRPCRVWLYNANSYKKFKFHRSSMIMHLLSTQMLRYKVVKFKRHIYIYSYRCVRITYWMTLADARLLWRFKGLGQTFKKQSSSIFNTIKFNTQKTFCN